MVIIMKLYEKIKNLRTSKGLSQAELAEKIELSHGHITRLETGKFNPSIEVLKKIADLFDVTTDFLLNENVDNTYDNGIQNEPLSNKIKMISTLEPKQQEAIITIIDSMLKERRMKEVLNQTLINV